MTRVRIVPAIIILIAFAVFGAMLARQALSGGREYDCKDFESRRAAIGIYHDAMLLYGKDLYGLDRNHDGVPCQDLPF